MVAVYQATLDLSQEHRGHNYLGHVQYAGAPPVLKQDAQCELVRVKHIILYQSWCMLLLPVQSITIID